MTDLAPDHPSTSPPPPHPHHQQHNSTSTSNPCNKRRRQSDHSTHTNSEPQHSSNANWSAPTPQRNLNLSSHSSRVDDDRDMHLSSATAPRPSAAVKYTRTGRVSKAAKGQRVHSCEECGKTYTRAEHLRRHQQNHKPGAYPCDILGCGRSFYREDLLVRHKARHNDPLNPPSRSGSVDSETPGPLLNPNLRSHSPPSPAARGSIDGANEIIGVGLSHNTTAIPMPQPRTGTRYEGSMSMLQPQPVGYSPSLAPRKNYMPIAEPPMPHQFPIAVGTAGSCSDYTYGAWDGSAYNSPVRYDSPTADLSYTTGGPYFDQLTRNRNLSASSFYGATSAPRSPASAGSSVTYMPQWAHGTQVASYQTFNNTSSGSESSYSNAGGIYNGFVEQDLLPDLVNRSRLISAQDRDQLERNHLMLPLPSDSIGLSVQFDSAFTEEDRYLNAYWVCVHPLFPVIHKPSFQFQAASPLLRAAIMTLGAQSLQSSEDVAKGRVMHERCLKTLKRRTIDQNHTYRVCDMQAIVLVEIYSVFKSRRPPLHFSQDFETVYRLLASHPEALTRDLAEDTPMNQAPPPGRDFLDVLNKSSSCKQRLLAACYVLDQQHSTIFGRAQTTCMTISGVDLLFPKSQSEWDTSLEQQALLLCQGQIPGEPCHEKIYEAMNVVPTVEHVPSVTYDGFQSQLMMACIADPLNEPQTLGCISEQNIELSPILLAMDQSARTKMAFHTFMLCKQTPVRDILAVAGESWVMAEKLGSQSEFTASQIEAHQWATGAAKTPVQVFGLQPPVQRAVHHATQIIALHHAQPQTGLLFQEWALYLAAVVLWARAYTVTKEPHQSRKPRLSLSIPNPSPITFSVLNGAASHELETSVMTLCSGGDVAVSTAEWKDTRNMLVWVKLQIEKVDVPHNCGLTNGALDVLGKLVARGNETGWFGSR